MPSTMPPGKFRSAAIFSTIASAVPQIFNFSWKDTDMKRRGDVKNDFLYGFVMLAFVAVIVFNVAVEIMPGAYEALKLQVDEAVATRRHA